MAAQGALRARSGPCVQLASSDPGVSSSVEGQILDQTAAEEAGGTKWGGLGLSLSSEENLALRKGAYAASSSRIDDAGILAAFSSARVGDEFLKRAPPETDLSAIEGFLFDPRRWNGRSADA
jgi:hypothetical protein